jgi:hypothetical protein
MQHSSPSSCFLTHATFLTTEPLLHTCNIPQQIATSSHMQHSSANSCFLTHATFLSKQLLPQTCNIPQQTTASSHMQNSLAKIALNKQCRPWSSEMWCCIVRRVLPSVLKHVLSSFWKIQSTKKKLHSAISQSSITPMWKPQNSRTVKL